MRSFLYSFLCLTYFIKGYISKGDVPHCPVHMPPSSRGLELGLWWGNSLFFRSLMIFLLPPSQMEGVTAVTLRMITANCCSESGDQPRPMVGQYYLFRVWAEHFSRYPDNQANKCPDSKCQEACVEWNMLLSKEIIKILSRASSGSSPTSNVKPERWP